MSNSARTTIYFHNEARLIEFPISLRDAQGLYLADVLVAYLPEAVVLQMLPDELFYAGTEETRASGVPIVFTFGYQQDVRSVIANVIDLNYKEIIIVIPNCMLKTPEPGSWEGPYCYAPRIFVNQFLATLLGWLCGYEKVDMPATTSGPLTEAPLTYEVENILRAHFNPLGPVTPPADAEGFLAVRRMFNQPSVGFTKLLDLELVTLVDFLFEDPGTTAQKISAEVDFLAPCVEHMPTGKFVWDGNGVSTNALRTGPAFRLRIPWRLSAPFNPREIQRVASA